MAELFAASPVLLAVVAGLFGLLIGSFLNVVILRLPARIEWRWRQEARELLEGDAELDLAAVVGPGAGAAGDANAQAGTPISAAGSAVATVPSAEPPDIVRRRSHCPDCGHSIIWWENIPLLSFALLRGRCRGCGKSISWQYPAVELVTGLLFAAVAWHFGFTWQTAVGLALVAALVALSGIDLRTTLLPDSITLPLLWLGLLASLASLYVPPADAIAGAAVGYLSLWSVYWLFKLATGKEGMGYGDFKLLAALGAFVGLRGILPILFISAVLGAIVGTLLIVLQGRDRAQPIPFGPWLAGAGLIEWLSQGRIFDAYMEFSGLAG